MRPHRARAALGGLLATATLLGLSLTGFTAQAADDNLALGKPVTASEYEVETTAPAKAVDGDLATRWGTSQNKAAGEWIDIDLQGEQTVRQIDIDFERTDAAQNITGYQVELKEGDTYTTVYTKNERAAQHEAITLDKDHTATHVKVTILNADGGTLNWVNVGINEIAVYPTVHEEVIDTPDTNHMLNATMTASSSETATLGPEKAIDRNRTDRANRWASDYETPSDIWLQGDFSQPTLIKDIRVYFFHRDAAPTPSNVISFDVTYTDIDGKKQTAKANWTMDTDGDGYATDAVIQLDTAITARSIKLENFAIGNGSWNNVSVAEWEVYSNDQAEPGATLDSVVDALENDHRTIGTDVDTLPEPTLPDGFTAEFNGADYEQLIAADGTINHPLTDRTVQVAYVVTDKTTGETATTSDIPYVVQGTKTQAEGMNAKPTIIPEIAEWHSDSTDSLPLNAINTVTYDDPSLKAVVDEFVLDYADFTGVTLNAVQDGAQAGAFNFSLTGANQLGDEGYTLAITADRMNAASQSVTGNMYAMQTILQMTRQDANAFPIGSMRDYPRFEVRGFLMDVARKPVSLEMMREVTRTMRYYKMNDFQAHLSDNYIFLENYGKGENENEAFKAYDAFRLESSLTNEAGESPTAGDYAISKADFQEFIRSERALGMNIVPEIDVPAHANSFTKVWPDLMVKNKVSPSNKNRPLIDHLDVSKPETIAKIKEIFDDYTKGDDPTFDAQTTVHIGADEFLADYTAYREFINELVPYVKQTNTVREWGGLTWIDDGKTQIVPEAIEDVQVNLWSSSWSDGLQMYEMGYDLINTIDDYGYMVPNGNRGRANSYGDLLNVTRIFDSFEPNRLKTRSGYKYVPSGDDQMLGAAFAIWSDNIDKNASGLTESDLYWRFFDAMPYYAEKTWSQTGKEKGSADALADLAEQQGTGPRINPYYQADSVDDAYASYDFEHEGDDATGNERDLTLDAASTKDGELRLSGGSSYATTPIDQLGNGNELTFDITLNKAAKPGDILFEADSAYGTHDLRIMDDGSLGFTRELYDYSFGYELPVGKKVTVTIAVDQQSTKLYVDGEYVADATGSFIHNGIVKKTGITAATFALPLQRVGSATQAVDATIDNVVVKPSTEAVDEYDKAAWTGTTNSETVYDSKEGLLTYAFDNKPGTHWHSNWQGATDKLTGSNSFYAEIDFGRQYEISQFSFTPRTDQPSGRVTKADLYVKAAEGDEWTKIAVDQTFANDETKKTFVFDARKVRYAKFVAKASNDGWVAVSEFDIANKPASTYRVFVAADPAEGGVVNVAAGTDDGTAVDVRGGSEVTVSAEANDGYTFAGWYHVGDEPVSEEASYTFAVEGNTALTARFTKDEVPPAPEPVDRTGLDKAIAAAGDVDRSRYTDKSLAALDAALATAEETNARTDATQADVDAAAKTLQDAIAGLEERPVTPPDPEPTDPADKTDLGKAIAAAKTIDRGLYTDKSLAALDIALAAAEQLSAVADATQADVDAAAKTLQDAIAGLEKKDDGSDTPVTPDPGDGDDKPGVDDKPGTGDKPGDTTKPDAKPGTSKPSGKPGLSNTGSAVAGMGLTMIVLAGLAGAIMWRRRA